MNLKEKLRAKIEEQSALLKAAPDEGRAFTAEEPEKFDTLEADIKALEKTIEAQQAAEKRAKTLETPADDVVVTFPKNKDDKK